MSGFDFFVDLTITGTVLGRDLPDRLDVDDLLKAVSGQGFPLEEQPCHDDDHVEFRSPVSRAARLLRDQIHEVQRASLTDPELAAELRRWGTVKPNLLAD